MAEVAAVNRVPDNTNLLRRLGQHRVDRLISFISNDSINNNSNNQTTLPYKAAVSPQDPKVFFKVKFTASRRWQPFNGNRTLSFKRRKSTNFSRNFFRASTTARLVRAKLSRGLIVIGCTTLRRTAVGGRAAGRRATTCGIADRTLGRSTLACPRRRRR